GSKAKPKRGARLFQSRSYNVLRPCPTRTRPTAGRKLEIWSDFSDNGPVYSCRRPKFRVSRRLIFQSSWMKSPALLVYVSRRVGPRAMLVPLGAATPARRSARLLKVNRPRENWSLKERTNGRR